MGQVTRPYFVQPGQTPVPHWYNSEQQRSELSAGLNRDAFGGVAAENQTKGAIHPQTLLEALDYIVRNPETLGDPMVVTPMGDPRRGSYPRGL